MKTKIMCWICGNYFEVVSLSHLRVHKITFSEYKEKFPHSDTRSDTYREKHRGSLLGRKLSDEFRKRLSEMHKGKIISEETRRRISETQKGRKCTEDRREKLREYYKTHTHPMQGKTHTKESKKKISETGIGRIPWNKGKIWPEHMYPIREKISQKLKGNKLSLETKRKMSESRKGRVLSEITKMKISMSKRGIKKTKEHMRKILESTERSPNKFEIECMNLFEKYNLPLKFVGDFNNKNFFISGKVPDFVSANNKKVIVEVFYEYFKIRQYGSVESYKEDRINTFSKYGWKTLFFTCDEIRKSPEKCIEELKKELI
ncbi:hypothetical protein HYV89_01325 [Candidatus Woesearchaeota archaeon]|nr:hypothetical protein [Candidatus Woesearchaeota archaeon]